MKHALTIAGSDSSGGAGIQADIKTFAAHGVYGLSVITAVTAQNTLGITCVEDISPETISRQIEAVFTDITVHAVKIGMLSNSHSILAVAEQLKRFHPEHIVLDPVMISKSGHSLLSQNAVGLLISTLFPLSTLVTPNIPEAEQLTGLPIHTVADMEKAAGMICETGPAAVLLKGGHSAGDPIDVLFDGASYHHYPGRRIQTRNTHGTGCTLSAAIAANLAQAYPLKPAVANAKTYITACIEHALNIGHGAGPLNHCWPFNGMQKKDTP